MPRQERERSKRMRMPRQEEDREARKYSAGEDTGYAEY